MYQDREGHEIPLLRWGALREDDSYRLVAHDKLSSAVSGEHELKTMWHGLVEDWLDEGLFSTGYTDPELGVWWTLAEYNSEQEAIEGHALLVDQVRTHGRPAPRARVPKGQRVVHEYLSTACLHGEHDYCLSMTGAAGKKRPGQCKFCEAICICPTCNHRGRLDPDATPGQ